MAEGPRRAGAIIGRMKIDDEVLGVLSTCSMQGNELVIPGKLDRKLYERTNKVLVALGGRWDKRARAHLFTEPVAAMVDRAILAGEVTDPRKVLGFFETPVALAEELVATAGVKPGMRCLEPNAGTGRIAEYLVRASSRGEQWDASGVHCVEIDPERALGLARSGYVVNPVDFLLVPVADHVPFDAVVMNPPFARQADVDHVTHALKFLRPGGVLVSVMSAGVDFRQDRKARAFRDLVLSRKGSIARLPSGSFKAAGTAVETVVVRMTA